MQPKVFSPAPEPEEIQELVKLEEELKLKAIRAFLELEKAKGCHEEMQKRNAFFEAEAKWHNVRNRLAAFRYSVLYPVPTSVSI